MLGETGSLESILVVADMHLKPLDSPNPEAVRLALLENVRLAAFLEKVASQAGALVLLGDTFNFWFERRSRVIGDYTAALSLFRLAADLGLEIHHVSGNRDFAVGEGLGFDAATRFPGFFRLRRGFTVSRLADFGIEPHGPRFRLNQQGKSITFVHGDALCGRQPGFRVARWLLQGPPGRLLFGWLPWCCLVPLITRVQAKTSLREPIENPGKLFSATALKREMSLAGDLLVAGHLHTSYSQEVATPTGNGKLVVLPAWVKGGYFGVIRQGEISVQQFLG
ncbi:MAG: UDP-2,3-diacylglucosamine diphosphatase [Planctomycetota bacterium]|jgi:UDP-2,3-diacylglucosamine pyrophosphatase LpxH|nr:UDP-2,3-diacylglucosamine diphosphatase [Planctomycetota bacterium]